MISDPFYSAPMAAWRKTLFAVCALLLSGCAAEPVQPTPAEVQVSVLEYVTRMHMHDVRGRFREIFCTVLEEHGHALPDYRPCEEALTRVGEEAGASGKPVSLGRTRADYLVLLVPGLGWECFEEWLDYSYSGPKHVARFGYDVRPLPVAGLSSSEHNAEQIREHIAGLPVEDAARPLILIGYSKGAPDILTALTAYPEIAERVAAVVSLAGVVGGSPLADDATQAQANLLTLVPGSACEKGDEGAVASLRTAVRERWLLENPLPRDIRYYSVVTYPDPDHISWGLQKSYRILSGIDARNDTQILMEGQMIPGSRLVAFVNADHWAIAGPVAREHPFVGETVVNHTDYPREALLEALLRFLEEDLARRAQ